MENKDKKSNILIIVIVILCMIIAGLVGFVVGGGVDKESNIVHKDDADDGKNDGNGQTEEFSVVVVNDLSSVKDKLEKFMSALGDCSDVAANYFTTKKVVASDISNELALRTAAVAFFNQKNSISAGDFSKKIAEYFGNDYVYKHLKYDGCIDHVYNANSNLYEYVETACGCTTGPNKSLMYNISGAQYEGDLLVLEVKVLFPANNFTAGQYHKYYKDASRTKEIAGLVYSEVQGDYLEEAYPLREERNYDKGGKYKFVLKKVTDDIYSFVSSEPVA